MRGLLNSDVSRRYAPADCLLLLTDGAKKEEKVQLLRRKEREGGEGGVPGFVKDEFNWLMTPDREEREGGMGKGDKE